MSRINKEKTCVDIFLEVVEEDHLYASRCKNVHNTRCFDLVRSLDNPIF